MLGEDRRIMLQVLAHKARILRNKAFLRVKADSDRQPAAPAGRMPPWKTGTWVMTEKIHNLTLSTRPAEAPGADPTMLESAFPGAIPWSGLWFGKGYLTVIYPLKAITSSACRYYEKLSVSLFGEEQDWLSCHSVEPMPPKLIRQSAGGKKPFQLDEAETVPPAPV